MKAIEPQAILLEILRVSLIAIRNLSEQSRQIQQADEKLKLWANLCHSLPAVLLGACQDKAVSYFVEGDLELFCMSYPSPRHADYSQIAALRAGLR